MATYILRLALKIITYLLALLTIVAAYGGYVDPRIWATPSFLVLVYPYLALLTLIAGVGWLISRRLIPAIVCGIALVATSGALFSNIPVNMPQASARHEKKFKLLTYNIMHARDARPDQNSSGSNRTLRYILDSGADIVCLQELYKLSTYEIPGKPQQLIDSLRRVYPYILDDDRSDLTLLSRYPAEKITSRTGYSWMPIYDLYRLRVGSYALHILNVHLAPYMLSEQERHVVSDIRGVRSARHSISEFKGSIFSKMKQAFRNRAIDAQILRQAIDSVQGPLIVCGDFNDVPASWTYRTVRGDDLKDAYTDAGLGLMNTYNLHGFYFHIDQIFYRGPLKPIEISRGRISSSDHFPVLATFAFTRR